MWKAAKWSVASLLVAIVIVLSGVVGHTIGETGGGTGGSPGNTRTTTGPDFGVLEEIHRILQEDFVDPAAVDPNLLRDGAIAGEIAALGDPHTVYISPEDYALGIDLIGGTFEGIGAQVDLDPTTGEIVIVAPFRGSPAEQAGILPGEPVELFRFLVERYT